MLENDLGLVVRPERRDVDWRYELVSADMAEIVDTVTEIGRRLDVDTPEYAGTAHRDRTPIWHSPRPSTCEPGMVMVDETGASSTSWNEWSP